QRRHAPRRGTGDRRIHGRAAAGRGAVRAALPQARASHPPRPGHRARRLLRRRVLAAEVAPGPPAPPAPPPRTRATPALAHQRAALVDSRQQTPQRPRNLPPPPRGGPYRSRAGRAPAITTTTGTSRDPRVARLRRRRLRGAGPLFNARRNGARAAAGDVRPR